MNARTRNSWLVLLALATLCLVSGCTTTPGNGSYQLKQTRNDVDWAMVRYHNRVSFGFMTTAEQDQVTAAYKAYQTAFNDVARQAHFNYTTPTPDNVKQLANQLLSLLASIP
jgi:hypothetical protein